jgi:hypothetical protein
MLMTTKRTPPKIRSLRGWAIEVLTEVHAIRECEDHGWMQDRADPPESVPVPSHAKSPRQGLSSDAASAVILQVLESIGDTCPECPPQ